MACFVKEKHAPCFFRKSEFQLTQCTASAAINSMHAEGNIHPTIEFHSSVSEKRVREKFCEENFFERKLLGVIGLWVL